MARIACTEDVEGIREEEDVGDEGEKPSTESDVTQEPGTPTPETDTHIGSSGRYIATSREVHDAFDSLNTLRYSQPTHLQGKNDCLTFSPR
jgi:cleavage and polyadenylation specificity factor subunit 2